MRRTVEEKALLLNKYIQEWFRISNKNEAKPKEIMPYLIEKGIYSSDNKKGNPLRTDLRNLRDKGLLTLIKGVKAYPKGKITDWYLHKVD